MNITREESKLLGRRAEQPVKAAGELLAIWCAGKLINPLNQGWGWAKHEHGYRRRWKERVALAILEAGAERIRHSHLMRFYSAGGWSAATPKRVSFHAQTWGKMDSDGLQAALKPVRDALVECGVISGDADKDGHVFVYEQTIDRARRGVTIRVTLRDGRR